MAAEEGGEGAGLAEEGLGVDWLGGADGEGDGVEVVGGVGAGGGVCGFECRADEGFGLGEGESGGCVLC